ncbi:hypothetical protein FJTKL_12666 [Diaporthe vaccinii]|uniref:Transketolase-like pyrimidine-binding domain-containing protein n=1 Tax=Diaporthe vaccinii TaxID=105482 RepID=A0ABR4ECN3_9PEZI
MRYNPADPEWFDRDLFVLSNGHASMFLYVMNYLVGYDGWTIDELKGYASPKENGYHTLCHGHPERLNPAVEVTTGPLGQGVANAVGLAIASKNLAANFSKPGYELIQSTIWCTTGDGCLMEGVALEAISLAGHLQLDNLVLIYDNNAVTCDGPLDWISTEDIDAKMRPQGLEVLDVQDSNYDVESLVAALKLAKIYKGKPVFVNVRTVIGVGTSTAGTHKAHHGVFDKESIASHFLHVFFLYAAQGVRMGALSDLQVVHIETHGSFQEGQNGPTHQPVEVDSLYRAMPNLCYIRPCDAEELIGAWTIALSSGQRPTMLSIARDPTGPVPNTDRTQVQRGAYVIQDSPDYQLTLVSRGSNLHYAVAAGMSLRIQGVATRIVSAPSLDLFETQDDGYKKSVFPQSGRPIVSVEEYVATTWARYVTASIGMTTCGYSASNRSNYDRFGLDAKGIETKVKQYLALLNGRSAGEYGWRQL